MRVRTMVTAMVRGEALLLGRRRCIIMMIVDEYFLARVDPIKLLACFYW